jgi:hypothetical protein
MVLRHARDTQENSLRRLDYVAYFARDPRIAAALGQYRLAEEVGQYLLYVRAGSSDQPGVAPKSEPGRYDVARPVTSVGWRALLVDRGFLPAVVVFLVLAVWGMARTGVSGKR